MGSADVFGASHAWFAESDPGASAVLAARFPGVPNHGDLAAFDWSTAEPVDVLCMGFPCQPFSIAGAQRGTADHRHLFPAIVGAIEKMPVRPVWIVVENVPRLVTIDGGAVWHYVQDELMRLGYAGVWRIAPAASVGAPHLRNRVVLVARLHPSPVMVRSAVTYAKDGAVRLPTPRTSDSRGAGRRMYGKTTGHDLREAIALLKTPTAQLAVNGGSQHPDKRKAGGHGPTLADEIEFLLPTPRATDGSNGGPNQRGRRGDLAMPSVVHSPDFLLPTPTGANSHGNSRGELLLPGAVRFEHFGKYAAAIERWAAVVGPPPPPREPGRTGERLSARFVEWMAGLPAGFVTDLGLTRAQEMRCLGNIVVPQFAARTVSELRDEL